MTYNFRFILSMRLYRQYSIVFHLSLELLNLINQ